MDKGTRVTITGGKKGKGVSGAVFWKGANKWGPGERLGIHGDDGETYWVSSEHVEASGQPAPPVEAGETFAKGDRVTFTRQGEERSGSVFWIGESRTGPGQRLGVRPDDDEEAVWIDARHVQRAEGGAPAQPAMQQAAPTWDEGADDTSADPAAWSPSLAVDDLPEAPPMDDSWADSAASGAEDDEGPPPEDWW